jgi:uncharacterized protein YqeY
MSKIDELTQEIISEYKAGNSERRVFLQTIKAALLTKQKEKGEITSEDEISVLKAELKQRQQAKAEYDNAGREDLSQKMDFEIAELQKMLPPQMGEEEIEKVVREVAESIEDKSFGSIMKESMIRLKGQADGSVVSQIVRKIIG